MCCRISHAALQPGLGAESGRALDSRHQFGDAADVIIDSDANGRMDDINHDGRVNFADARVILAAVERVERAYPISSVASACIRPVAGRSVRAHRRARRACALGTRRPREEITTSSLAYGEIEPAKAEACGVHPRHLDAVVHAFRRHYHGSLSNYGDTAKGFF